MGSDAAVFVKKVKDQMRSRQECRTLQIPEKSIQLLGNVHGCDDAATFMGKNFVEIQNSIMNSRDLTLKHTFDITLKLVSDQDEINNLDNNYWGKNSWNHLSLIGDEPFSIFNAQTFTSSQILCCVLEGIHHFPRILNVAALR